MKTVFFGTPSYSIASIRALIRAGIEVPLVCTRPARRSGRGRGMTATPVAQFAQHAEIPVITPNKIDDQAIENILAAGADALVVVAYGRLLPSELLTACRLGAVNIHPSLLPRHRGPSPVVTSILQGDDYTGVTLMQLDDGMDTGPILAQSERVKITSDTRCEWLTEHLFDVGAELLPRVLRELDAGIIAPRAQDEAGATVTEIVRKEHGVVDWASSADRIVRMNRAYDAWPGTNTTWEGQNLKLVDVELAGDVVSDTGFEPGEVYRDDCGVYVATGDSSALRLKRIQLAGKSVMDVGEFVRGRPNFVGSRLGA